MLDTPRKMIKLEASTTGRGASLNQRINQMFYGVFTEDGLDQVCDTMAQAKQERRDLKTMGCEVWIAHEDDGALWTIDGAMQDGMGFKAACKFMMED